MFWFLCKPKHVGKAFIILIYFNNSTFTRCVHLLDNKVFDIIDARFNYEDLQRLFVYVKLLIKIILKSC